MPDSRAGEIVARVASEDSDPGVRRAALFAVVYRAPSEQHETAGRRLTDDAEPAVRSTALWLIEDLYHGGRPVEELLRWSADNDGDPELRQRARRVLASAVLPESK